MMLSGISNRCAATHRPTAPSLHPPTAKHTWHGLHAVGLECHRACEHHTPVGLQQARSWASHRGPGARDCCRGSPHPDRERCWCRNRVYGGSCCH